MIELPTPETDAKWQELCCSNFLSWRDIAENIKTHCQEKERERYKTERTTLSVAISERNDALNQLTGWENKSKLALEIAASAKIERDEANEELNKKYIEYDKLFDEAELIRIERDQILQALMKIEEIFIDGEDTYDDWLAMGKIARATLENLNQQ